jgi:predicted nucleic acid-binding protein
VRGSDLGIHLAAAFGLMNQVNRPLVSIVSHGELRVLADRNKWGSQKLAAMQATLASLVTLDLSEDAVLEAYVDVQRVSRNTAGGSKELKANDAWIVACAKAADATLLTTDRDFAHLRLPDWNVQFVDPGPFLQSHAH